MKIRHLLPLLSLSLLPGIALAHTGHAEHGFTSGLMHPVGGLDHLLAMLAVGIWAALQSRTTRLATPATFLTMLLAGFALAIGGIALPQVETGVGLSVLLLGLLIASSARLPQAAAMLLAGTFALFHGYAHGVEASGSLLAFAAGLTFTSLALHLAGGLFGAALQQRVPALARALGAAIATSGALLMA